METNDSKYVRAHLKLKSTEDGGRKSPILNGYRPNHVFEYIEGHIVNAHIGEIQLENGNLIEPGSEGEVVIRFLLDPKLEAYLIPGKKWWIHEGSRVVGEATVVEIIS